MATLDQIVAQLAAADHPRLPDGHPVADGKPHRYGPKKKHWYSLHEIVKAGQVIGYAGAFGCWSADDNGAQSFRWEGAALSPEDMAATRARQEATAREEQRKREQAAKLAANRARQQWHDARDDGTSAYLDRKRITPEGVRFAVDGDVLVPMFQYADGYRLVGLQKITPDGAKRFNKGMEKKGAAFLLGDVADGDKVVMVAEGYATARSIRMATNEAIPVAVCFDAGNMLATTRYLRDTHRSIHVLVCADDDWKIEQRMRDHLAEDYGYVGELVIGSDAVTFDTRGNTYTAQALYVTDEFGVRCVELSISGDSVSGVRTRRFENAGLKRAREAASAIGNASVCFPAFENRGDRKLTDFNDLHCEQGVAAVKQQVERALLAALAPSNDEIPPYPHLKAVEATAPAPVRATSAAAREEEVDERNAEDGAYNWEWDLARSDKGKLLPTLGNVHMILSNHEAWDDVIAHDDFGGRVVKRKAPPFQQGEAGEWSDMDDIRCSLWLSQKFGISVRQDIVMNAVLLVADQHHFHDVREYLEGIKWDGTPRLSTWAAKYLMVADSPYVQLAATKWMIAAVARVMRPGCKADNVLILEGKQGWGKSTALEVLAGKQWYTNSPIRIGEKDSYAVMSGKWIVELAELDSLNKTDSSAAKSFFATETDRFRNFYGKRATDVHRQGVFAGSVNFDTYLKDESGNRRYWPLRVGGPIDLDGLRDDRDQLWAEAMHLYRAGTIWHVTEDERPLFELEQAERYEGDVYEDKIGRALETRERITMEELLGDVLGLDTSKWTPAEQRRVGKAMKSLGWVRKRESKGKRGWYYVKEELPIVIATADTPRAPGEDDDSPL